jgi:IS605 OrfB family transposase
MTLITVVSKIIADEHAEAILLDAMRSATKVYSGLIWQLREQYEQSGKAPISRKNLNRLMKLLPRAQEYYSQSAQATRDEVIEAYKSYFALRQSDEHARPPGFRRRARYSTLRYYDGYGFRLTEEGRLQLSLGRRRTDGVRCVEIDRKEARQVNYRLHLITKDFVERCYRAGVRTIVLGDVKGIRKQMRFGRKTNQRLHAWSFSKVSKMIAYKASLHGMTVVEVCEAYTSQRCHQCGEVSKANRRQRGLYECACGWRVQADVNAAANVYERFANVSPLKRSSGRVASPVVVPLRCNWHTVCEPGCP